MRTSTSAPSSNSGNTGSLATARYPIGSTTLTTSYAWYSGLLGLILCALASTSSASLETLDSVAAIVDDDVIMASELDERIGHMTDTFRKQGRPVPPASEMRQGVLEQLIVENLQLQMARRAGVRIADAQLNDAMLRIAESNNLSLDEFRDKLESEGLSYAAAREQVRRDVTIQQVQMASIRGQVDLTEQDVENFLNSEEGKSLIDTRYQLAHILIPAESLANAADESRQRALLSRAASEIRAGTPLLQWLRDYNRSASEPLRGGDLGWRSNDELPAVFADVVPPLAVKDVAGPLRSAGGLHLVQLSDRRGGAQIVEQTHARHILLKPSEIRNEQQCEKLLKQLRKRILDGEAFADLARQYTEDLASAQEGGDLGWANKGQFVPAFEDAMARTQVNTITQPFRSKFGWHILEVLERRKHDISGQAARDQAYRYLYQRKFQAELETWLQKIRDEAYVDIKV